MKRFTTAEVQQAVARTGRFPTRLTVTDHEHLAAAMDSIRYRLHAIAGHLRAQCGPRNETARYARGLITGAVAHLDRLLDQEFWAEHCGADLPSPYAHVHDYSCPEATRLGAS